MATVALSAAIGAAVGAGVTAATSGGGGVTIQQTTAPPGAAPLGRTNVPSLVARLLPTVVSIDVRSRSARLDEQGSGMIVSANGMVVTNDHVVAPAKGGRATITVTEAGTRLHRSARLIGATATSDLALVQMVGASGLPTVTFGNSAKAEVGDSVVAIGNALGLGAGTPTVTEGIVSALGRTVTASAPTGGSETLTDLMQTDAAINPGNSGGPLVDDRGDVIAMNTAVAGTDSEGGAAQGIGFAIPSATIEALIPELQKGEIAGGAYLGVLGATVTPQIRHQDKLTPHSGALVVSVLPGSPAKQARLKVNDVVVAIGTTKIVSAQQLIDVVTAERVGQSVTVTFYRGSAKHTVRVTLANQAQAQAPAQPRS